MPECGNHDYGWVCVQPVGHSELLHRDKDGRAWLPKLTATDVAAAFTGIPVPDDSRF